MYATTLFALLSTFSSALASHNVRRPNDHAHLARLDAEARALRELEERLMRITATTTVYVEETMTQTIWVHPTDQAPFIPGTTVIPSEISSATSGVSTSSGSAASSVSSAFASTGSSSLVPGSSASVSVEASSASAVSSSASEEASSSFIPTSAESSAASVSTVSVSASGSGILSEASSASSAPAASAASASSWEESASSMTITSYSSAPASSGSNSPSPSRASGSGPPRSSPAATSSATATVTQEEVSSSTSSFASATSAENSSVASRSLSAESSSLSQSESSSASASRETHWSTSATSIMASVSSAAPSSSSSAVSSSSTESAASSTSSAAASGSTLLPLGPRLMNAYYPDWASWHLSPESVDWSKYDVLDFAFALPTADGGLRFTQDDSSDLLRRLVKTGHAARKRVKLSIGGWTGSAYFSTITASDSLRATFVANIVQAYHAYNIDGVDIDWEYPGTGGAAGNAVSRYDSANYLKLLQDLRKALPDGALLTTATQVWPFADDSDNARPMKDVSAFAEVLDWILIMNYDIWGSGDENNQPGPNAPLSDACGNSTQPLANAYAAVSSWSTAGMPLSKITLGVPAYGYLSKSWSTSLRQRRSTFPTPPHKRDNSPNARAAVTVYNGNGQSDQGQVMFYELLNQGALVSDWSGNYAGAGGFTKNWDECSSTPWLKSDTTGQIITYDDAQSMSLKGQFAAQSGIRGCNVFSIDGDYVGNSFPLTDAVRSGMGL